MNTYFETFPDSYDPESIRILNTPSILAKSAFFYVQEVGYLKIRQSHLTKRENLDSYLFVILLSGAGILNYKGITNDLIAGDCFWIDCNLPHSYQSKSDNPWELLWVHFNGSTSKQYYEHFITQQANAWHTSESNRFESILREIISLYSQKQVHSEIISSKLISDLLTMILTSLTESNTDPAHNASAKLLAIRAYIDSNYLTKLNLSKISEEFFISKFHLSREFKKTFGQNISDYIQLQRITYSKRILRFSDKSMEEVSTLCQITDASHFTKVFRASEGLTPTSFRKKWREKR